MVRSVLAAQAKVQLPDGTPVQVRLLRVISSDLLTPGEPVPLAVAMDVTVDGATVIAGGTPVVGTIVDARPSKPPRRPARVRFAIRETRGVDSQPIRLRVSPTQRGQREVRPTGTRSALLVWVAGGRTFRPLWTGITRCPRCLPQHLPRSLEVLTDQHIVQVVAAGLSEDLLVAKIHASRTAFRVGTDDLIQLKKTGVSDRVTMAIIEAVQGVTRVPKSATK